MRLAAIGDPHGCIDELVRLYRALEWHSLDQIWGLGDLVDRGPESGEVVSFYREKKISSVLGNHEESILGHWKRKLAGQPPPKNPDKRRTLEQLSAEDFAYLEQCPRFHVVDALNLILVHGGLWPELPLHRQPDNVVRAQMIHPDQVGRSRWWGPAAATLKFSEEQSRAQGWRRWYEFYDHPQRCVYGHSVYAQPFLHQNEGAGTTYGIDTGSCFGGSLTAALFSSPTEDPIFLSVKARTAWASLTGRSLAE